MSDKKTYTHNPEYSYEEAESLRQMFSSRVRQMREHYQNLSDILQFLNNYREKISLLGGYFAWNDMQAIAELWKYHQQELINIIEALKEKGIIVRDPEKGLIDIPGRLDDQPIYWCWKPDESVILYYHDIDAGFAGRKPVPRKIRQLKESNHEPVE